MTLPAVQAEFNQGIMLRAIDLILSWPDPAVAGDPLANEDQASAANDDQGRDRQALTEDTSSSDTANALSSSAGGYGADPIAAAADPLAENFKTADNVDNRTLCRLFAQTDALGLTAEGVRRLGQDPNEEKQLNSKAAGRDR